MLEPGVILAGHHCAVICECSFDTAQRGSRSRDFLKMTLTDRRGSRAVDKNARYRVRNQSSKRLRSGRLMLGRESSDRPVHARPRESQLPVRSFVTQVLLGAYAKKVVPCGRQTAPIVSFSLSVTPQEISFQPLAPNFFRQQEVGELTVMISTVPLKPSQERACFDNQ